MIYACPAWEFAEDAHLMIFIAVTAKQGFPHRRKI
jgi:hypothetical protein